MVKEARDQLISNETQVHKNTLKNLVKRKKFRTVYQEFKQSFTNYFMILKIDFFMFL